MIVPSSSPDGGFPVSSRNLRVPSFPVKRYPAGTLISAMSPSRIVTGPSIQSILGADAAFSGSSASRKSGERARNANKTPTTLWRRRTGRLPSSHLHLDTDHLGGRLGLCQLAT